MISSQSLFDGGEIRVPKWNTLEQCQSLAQFKALVAPTVDIDAVEEEEDEEEEKEDNIEETFITSWFRNVVALPPFLANALIDSGSRDPCELIVEAMNAISSFDTSFEEDDDMPEAQEHAAHIVQFLWAAAKREIGGSPLMTAEEPFYLDWSEAIHKECLATPPPTTDLMGVGGGVQNSTMQSIASSLSVQGQTLEKMNDLRKEASAEKKKSYNQLHPVRIRLLLNASSTDGKNAAVDPTADAQSFYECKTVGAAKIHLEHSLQAVNRCIINLSTGFVTSLYTGAFIWDSPSKPNNWNGFQFAKPAPDSASGVQEALILSLKATEGKGWSETDILKALVQGLVVAQSVPDMQHNWHNEHATATYFFGAQSKIAQGLHSWTVHVRDHFQVYEELQAKDSTFVAQVIYSASIRIQNWFQECLHKDIRDTVDDSLIDFSETHRSIINRQFQIALPVSISNFSKPSSPPSGYKPSSSSPQGEDKSTKKRKNKKQGGRETVGTKNSKTISSWLLQDGEDYRKIFAGKAKPKFASGNCRWCPRWHTKGQCFDDCPDVKNHIPSMDIPKEHREDYTSHCKECRGN